MGAGFTIRGFCVKNNLDNLKKINFFVKITLGVSGCGLDKACIIYACIHNHIKNYYFTLYAK